MTAKNMLCSLDRQIQGQERHPGFRGDLIHRRQQFRRCDRSRGMHHPLPNVSKVFTVGPDNSSPTRQGRSV